MADADMMAMMGFSGFGKTQKKKKTIDIGAFTKNKRVRCSLLLLSPSSSSFKSSRSHRMDRARLPNLPSQLSLNGL